jgi:ATP-binding cassette subfamily C protein CydC
MEYGLPAAAIRALALIRAGGRYAERLVNHNTTLRILSGLRVWFFQRIEPLAPARLSEYRSGDLLSRIRADVDSLEDFHVRGVVPAVVAFLAACCIVPWLLSYDWRLALIDVSGLAIAGVLLPLLLKRLAERPGRDKVELAADLRASVVEEVQGLAELHALGALDAHERKIAEASGEMDLRQRSLASLQGVGDAGLLAASSLAVWGAAAVLAPLIVAGRAPRADMAMLTVFMFASFEAVLPLPAVIQRTGELAAAARRLFEIIDARPAVAEPEIAVPQTRGATGGVTRFPALPGPLGLSIHGLRFRYSTDRPPVFDGLSFEAPPGGRIALTGPTGSGKSSLVNLLLRFWDYEAGTILLVNRAGGMRDLRSLGGDDARKLLSVAPQLPHMFHMSIRENLRIACPEASDSDLMSALDAVQLGDLVSRLPQGLDTEVGEAGRELSIGEVRRIAVARALLKDAPFLILDEPTEGLDDPMADALLSGVLDRCKDRTVLILSHRPRDIAAAESVIELPVSNPP